MHWGHWLPHRSGARADDLRQEYPLPVYASILTASRGAVDSNACIMFADDRHLPVDSPDNNYGNARSMIEALGIKPETPCGSIPSFPWRNRPTATISTLRTFLNAGGTIPVALLFGADGHTCSLFNERILPAAGAALPPRPCG